jgi:hypothetical protein
MTAATLPGQLLTVYVLATLLAAALGAWLARRYRAALLPLMRSPHAPTGDGADVTVNLAQATTALPSWRAPAAVTLAGHRAAQARLVALLIGLSMAIALTRGAIWLWLVRDEATPFSLARLVTLAVVYAWPLLPALGLMWRWSWGRLGAALIGWYLASLALVMLRSTEAQSFAGVAGWLAWEIGPPTLALMLLTLRRTRAAAPWLWPPLALLLMAALLGWHLLYTLVEQHSPLIAPLVTYVSPGWAMLLFALGGVALGWWPVRIFARWLARLYAAKKVSDLMVIFSAAWALNIGFDALGSPLVLVALLWIPLALWWLGRRRAAAITPPTLLVLRVFKQEQKVGAVFDDVIERWRASGNTVLIAGTDLVDQTLDATDLFDYLDGRLAARFIRSPGEVSARLATFDWLPDADGRWRVNECYCHDSTWQVALAALVDRADLVLMDLRGFAAHNAGCRFELGVLARAAHLQTAVVLTDPSTDLATARADTAAAPRGRFVWVDLPADALSARRATRRRVMTALLGDAGQHGRDAAVAGAGLR